MKHAPGPLFAGLALLSAGLAGLAWHLFSGRKTGNAGPAGTTPPAGPATPTPAPTKPKATPAIPDVSHLVKPATFDAFPAWVIEHEGYVPHLYQDVKGLVTTGIGNLVDPIERTVSLPWLREDNTPATDAEIRADWQRVKAQPPALVASKYTAPGALHLSPEGVAHLVRRQNALNVQFLANSFPDLPSYPPNVQTALMGMAWALGAGFAKTFPTFAAAVRARDWTAAAEHSSIKNANASRNKAHRDLLLSAVGVA